MLKNTIITANFSSVVGGSVDQPTEVSGLNDFSINSLIRFLIITQNALSATPDLYVNSFALDTFGFGELVPRTLEKSSIFEEKFAKFLWIFNKDLILHGTILHAHYETECSYNPLEIL